MNEPLIVSAKGREILRNMVDQENQLRNQRLGYLLTLNGLLFAALGFAWKASHARSLVIIFSSMGILVAMVGLGSMVLSDRAIRYLRNRGPTTDQRKPGGWNAVDETDEIESIPVALSRAQIKDALAGDRVAWWDLDRIIQPWHSLPVILFGAWVAILIVGIKFLR
jgi:hypothetical protein